MNRAAVPQTIDETLETRNIPYNSAAAYIYSQLEGNSSKLWSRWGPSSLSFYLNKYRDYGISAGGNGEYWKPNTENDSVTNFVAFLNSSGYMVVAISTPEIAKG